jgi:hypothetical protein
MIKKFNVILVFVIVALFAVKGLNALKDAKSKKTARGRQDAVVKQEVSHLAPTVYYSYWAGYTLENPISNRNGVLLDIVRAIFPQSEFRHLHGEVDAFVKALREDPKAVVVGFGEHPALKEFTAAPTPLMTCPLVVMTLRTNPWRFKDFSSLTNLRIVADEAFLDFKAVRDLRERLGKDSPNLRLLPSSTSKVEMGAMVEKGEADAFVMADLKNAQGAAIDGLTSTRFLQNFRKSKMISSDGTVFYVSGKDPDFAKRLVGEFEAGFRRIKENGQLRRIREYYGIPSETNQPGTTAQ